MNEKELEKISKYLKETILKKGTAYLSDNAFEVYKGLKGNNVINVATLSCLLNGICEFILKDNVDYDDLVVYIKENCLLNEEAASFMALLFLDVFSKEQQVEYEDKKEKGLKEFCDKKHKITWNGFTRWYDGSVHVDCFFKADFSFVVKDKKKIKKDNLDLIKKNPYLSADFFYRKYKEDIIKELDEDFEYYCTCDDYYPPACEDYMVNLESLLESYFKKHGFKMIDCDGEGETSDFQR